MRYFISCLILLAVVSILDFGTDARQSGIDLGNLFGNLQRNGWTRRWPSSFRERPFIRRPSFLLWEAEAYEKWTKWSVCGKQCRKYRYRMCRAAVSCTYKYLVETKKCNDHPMCQYEAFQNVTFEQNITSNCGIRPPMNMRLKIMGGKDARPHSWPWQASLSMSSDSNAHPMCGATLIGSRFVVTAAHCFVVNFPHQTLPYGKPFYFRGSKVRVRIGDHQLTSPERHERTYKALRVIIHPAFSLSLASCHNDIAVILLNETVKLSKQVNVACLPENHIRLQRGSLCTALGWGVVKMKRRTTFWHNFFEPRKVKADILQEVQIPLKSPQACMSDYPNSNMNGSTQVCAGGIRGKDTCKGDSGGPLLCPIKVRGQVRWFLYGITSFGSQRGCGTGHGVYSRVSHFSEWIEKAKEQMINTIR